MAIVQEHFMIGNIEFVRTYSDKGFKVHGGMPESDYDEANDPAEFGRTYTETDIPIGEETYDADKAEAYDILIGEEE